MQQTPAPLWKENFPWPSFVVIVVSNPWKVNSRLSKRCETPHNLSSKNARAHREPIETGKSSKFCNIFFDSCLFFSYPLEQASIFDVRLCWNARLECLNNLPFPTKVKSSTWMVKMDTVLWFSRRKWKHESSCDYLSSSSSSHEWSISFHSFENCFNLKLFRNSHIVPSVMRFAMRNDQKWLFWISLKELRLLEPHCSWFHPKHHRNRTKEPKCCESCARSMYFKHNHHHMLCEDLHAPSYLAPQDLTNRSSLYFEHPLWPK